MVIDAKKLKDAGITVRVFEHVGNGEPRRLKIDMPYIEVFVEHGDPIAPAILKLLEGRIQAPEYREALAIKIADRIINFQIIEAIERTE